MFRSRSYTAFAITPQPPIVDWLADLDGGLERSEGFFAGQPVALDLSAVNLSPAAIGHLVASLEERNIHVLGIEGVDPAKWQVGLPPVLRGGRSARAVDSAPPALPAAPAVVSAAPAVAAVDPAPQKQQMASLLIEDQVRSGQSVVFIEGDVTVLGSVGSGAEIVAGGSIHVYGTLRGRAMAGVNGNSSARIYCQRIEAELLAIDGYYQTAEELDANLRFKPVQARLDGKIMRITALN